MSVPTLDEQWKDFKLKSKLSKAPLYQKEELEFAFKCGAASILVLQLTEVAKLKVDEGIEILQSWMEEFTVFINIKTKRYNGKNN